MPFVPAEIHGQLVVTALMAYAGDEEAGQRALAPFRDLATPIADLLHPMPCGELKGRYDPTNLFHRNQNIPPADL